MIKNKKEDQEQGIIDSTKEALKSRINNPFIGSFVISWILWNWKAVLFLAFANKDIERKIEILQSDYFNTDGVFLGPLYIALAISLFSPLFQVIFRWYQDWTNSKIRKNEIQLLKVIAIEEINYKSLQKGFNKEELEIELESIKGELKENKNNYNVFLKLIQKEIYTSFNELLSEEYIIKHRAETLVYFKDRNGTNIQEPSTILMDDLKKLHLMMKNQELNLKEMIEEHSYQKDLQNKPHSLKHLKTIFMPNFFRFIRNLF